ncbi:MAG: hypothetical protein IJX88_03670, partial [Clostridia bacterium]|nr:hypothetical protein [Clostridia bacterium]
MRYAQGGALPQYATYTSPTPTDKACPNPCLISDVLVPRSTTKQGRQLPSFNLGGEFALCARRRFASIRYVHISNAYGQSLPEPLFNFRCSRSPLHHKT